MSGWNHRVMHHVYKSPTGIEEEFFEIHEVYYDDNDKVDGYTKNAIAPGGNTVEELRAELQRMLDCLNKPVLEYEEESNFQKPSSSS